MVYIVLRDVGRGVNTKACGDGDVSGYDNCLTGLVYLTATCSESLFYGQHQGWFFQNWNLPL